MTREDFVDKIIDQLNLSRWELLDYGECYYEGDTPSLNIDVTRDIINSVIKENKIVISVSGE